MKTQTSTLTEYNLNQEEWNLIKICVNYSHHRLKKHADKGIHRSGLTLEQVEKFIEESKKLEKEEFEEFDKELDKILEPKNCEFTIREKKSSEGFLRPHWVCKFCGGEESHSKDRICPARV